MTAAAWDRIAYVTRYGHQAVSEVRSWPIGWMDSYHGALSRLVARENSAGKEE